MEKRLANLLKTVVEEYVRTAEPVGSQRLVAVRGLDVSPATIRNWFAELEELGLLVQPHTSGGRLPTEKGFRFYVEQFVSTKALSKRERDALDKLAVASRDSDQRLKTLAKGLAELSGLAAIVGLRRADTFYTGLSQLFAQPEFQNWQRVVNLSEVLDHLDEALIAVRRQRIKTAQIRLGSECPFGAVCGVVIVNTDDALFGLLGPLRMDYQRALSLVTAVAEILSK